MLWKNIDKRFTEIDRNEVRKPPGNVLESEGRDKRAPVNYVSKRSNNDKRSDHVKRKGKERTSLTRVCVEVPILISYHLLSV